MIWAGSDDLHYLACVQMTTTTLLGLGSVPAPATLCQEVVNHLDDLKPEIRNATPTQVEALSFSLTLHPKVTNPFVVRMIHEKVTDGYWSTDGYRLARRKILLCSLL